MSLLHPTPGEIIDRLTIVDLKLKAFRKAERDTSALEAEKLELQQNISRLKAAKNAKALKKWLENINLTIWKAEDDVRAWRSPHGHDKLAEFSLKIARYNDYRSKVIREIDLTCGTESIEEKIYR